MSLNRTIILVIFTSIIFIIYKNIQTAVKNWIN